MHGKEGMELEIIDIIPWKYDCRDKAVCILLRGEGQGDQIMAHLHLECVTPHCIILSV